MTTLEENVVDYMNGIIRPALTILVSRGIRNQNKNCEGRPDGAIHLRSFISRLLTSTIDLINLDQISASIVEYCCSGRAHIGGLHRKLDA